MASKEVVSPIKNAEKAVATEATFGKTGDPWRQGPALAGFAQALSPDHGKIYGDYQNAGYTDRFGTGEIDTTPMNGHDPVRTEAAQLPDAAQKGATATNFRVPISGVVQ